MAINFKKIAQRETVLSEIMESRQKVEKKDGIVTIVDFDIVSNKDGEAYAVCAINDTEFINGGTILTNIFTSIVREFNGDIEQARAEYAKSEKLKVKLTKTKTKSGRDLTKVEVL